MAALVNDDRIYETSTTTGTGSYALAGAVTGFQAFSVIGAGNYCWYFATDDVNWEVGIGTYSASPDTLARTRVIYSSNGDAAVDWAAGTRKIRCGLPAWAATPQILSKSVAGSSNVTLTAYEQRRKVLVLTGTLTGNIDVIVDTTVWDWIVYNNTAGAYTLTVKVSGQTGVPIPQGTQSALYCNGTDVVRAAEPSRKAGSFSFDISAANGTTAVTGLGFKPRAVHFVAAVNGDSKASAGVDDGVTPGCIFQSIADGTSAWGVDSTYSIRMQGAAGNFTGASITSLDADGFTITRAKTGSPTGTCTVKYIAYA